MLSDWQRRLLGLCGLAVWAALTNAAPVTTPDTRPKVAPPAAQAKGATAPNFSRLAALAAEAQKVGRLDEAIGYYERALRQKPSWVEGRWTVASLLFEQKRFAESRRHTLLVVQARPKDGTVLARKALCDARLGEDLRAVTDLRQALTLGIGAPPVKAAATLEAALLTNKLGDPDGAFHLLRFFGEENDDRPEIIEAFGLATLRLPWAPQDIPAEKRELITLAGRAGYHMARPRRTGVTYLARLALEELLSRYPSEPNVHFAHAMLLLSDDPQGAIDAFQRELKVSPNHHMAMTHLALAELARGRADVALPLAEKAARLAPNLPAARMALGQALLALGQADRAVEEMEAAVKVAPQVPRLRYNLAQAYQRAGRPDDAARERAEFQRLRAALGEPDRADERGVPPPPTGGNRNE